MCESRGGRPTELDLGYVAKLSLMLDVVANLIDPMTFKSWEYEEGTPGRELVDIESHVRTSMEVNLIGFKDLVLYSNANAYVNTLSDLLLSVMEGGYDSRDPVPTLMLLTKIVSEIDGNDLLPNETDLVRVKGNVVRIRRTIPA